MIAGRYSLTREIGRGGMGAVWLGRDELLGRQVALKRIGFLPGEERPDVARAEREARLSAQLHHPHVVSVFDVADDDKGVRWLVMEYVDGPSLDQVVRRDGAMSPEQAAPLLREISDALVAAHGAGIVHRDVKPSNVILDPSGHAKLADFGIARLEGDPALTQTGLVTGSPAYLAPEIAAGGRGAEAADVWSLGAMAYHLLAGRPPYEVGDNVLGALYRIVHEDPPRVDAGILAPLLEGTMTHEPEQRWTMTQVRDFLADPRAGAPAGATRTMPAAVPGERAGTPRPAAALPLLEDTSSADPKRRRGPGLLIAAAVVVVLLGLVAYAVLAGRHSPSSAQAPATPSPSAKPTKPAKSPSKRPSHTPTKTPSETPTPTGPTRAGMESFIRDYVTTVGDDPSQSWTMLTPKFQRESGGYARYYRYWDAATNGRVLSISANPNTMSVSYQVRFDNWHNGTGPTILDLKYEDGRYRIDGEHSAGFVPQG